MPKKYRRTNRIRRKRSALKVMITLLKSGYMWTGFLSILIVGSVAYILILSPYAQLRDITVSGAEKVPEYDVVKLAYDDSLRSILTRHTIPVVLLNTNNIESDLLGRYPVMESVVVNVDYLERTMHVHITERVKAVSWCNDAGICYSVDGSGVVFEETDRGGYPEITVRGLSEISLGDSIISESNLEHALMVNNMFSDTDRYDISMDRLDFIPPDRINGLTSEGWYVYLDSESNQQWQVDKLRAVLDDEVSEKERRELDYIDVRFGDQAYYK